MIGSIDSMKEYIKEIMETNEEENDVKYDITDSDIEIIIDKVFDNDMLWEVINDVVEYELQKYEMEGR